MFVYWSVGQLAILHYYYVLSSQKTTIIFVSDPLISIDDFFDRLAVVFFENSGASMDGSPLIQDIHIETTRPTGLLVHSTAHLLVIFLGVFQHALVEKTPKIEKKDISGGGLEIWLYI